MTEYLDKNGLAYLWKKIKTKIYPVGSIYISTTNTSPASLWGGSWEKIAAGRCLIGSGDGFTAGATGGEAIHSHTYGVSYNAYYGTMVGKDGEGVQALQFNDSGSYSDANGINPYVYDVDVNNILVGHYSINRIKTNRLYSLANTTKVSSMQPYLVVNIWKRTA